jgi:predicted homoserine dehydrogenase-like protein
MIIVDRALQAREDAGNPVRVGLVGAGFAGRGIARQMIKKLPGMRLVAISNRTIATAHRAYEEAGVDDAQFVDSVAALDNAITSGRAAVTDNAHLLAEAEGIDVLIEATGTIEFAAGVVLKAIDHGKHIILVNAEVDGTLGPILKVYADRAGVIISGCDGDQPGVEMNLYRYVKSIGMTPLLCGNIKGLEDHYRTPTTQQGFADRTGQRAYMVTSFADGTKISFEQALVANATGMRVARRGMLGYEYDGHIDDMRSWYDADELRQLGGIVDYVVGTKPGGGIFVFAAQDDPELRPVLDLFKLGEGPLYSFYVPFHLCHFEVPFSVGRVALLNDPVIQPLAGPVVDVVAAAKTDLKVGQELDGIGYYMTYGQCENYEVVRAENLLPMGLAEGCRLRHDVPRDHFLTYDDVELPPGRLADRLRAEQVAYFETSTEAADPRQPLVARP